MAKTYRNLWPQFASWENLLAAYQKCRRCKRYRQPACEFDFAWEQNLLVLQRHLMAGTYKHGPYYHFHISDPKPRLISAAPFRDRVVHHALVAVLEPIFERRFLHDSYACRVDKGTHRAIKRTQHFQRRFQWCLKTDIVKFFPSVDHEVLRTNLRRRVADPRVMQLIDIILESGVGQTNEPVVPHWFPGDDLLAALRPRGLPIGNLTSQFFANVFLDPVDHFIKEELIKEELRIPGFVRYADDLLLFANSRQHLWEATEALVARLAACRLRLHSEKTHVQPTQRPITFLGFQVGRSQFRLSQQGLRRFIRRTRRQRHEFAQGDFSLEDVPVSLAAWQAHLRGTISQVIQKVLIRQHLRFRRKT
ncbi:MAG: group II intron reverse transcriptase domain-containing protein [Planctomycetaceae bacterium]|nr:group II intron reverse transcriptase domain-containing protein [Planctomycetaceae bacterium]MCA9035737.1 group II intron reverse transcriptase domain-containing protein [Planctomycetaceae bacterium]